MARRRWWSRTRGLPPGAYEEWRTSLTLSPGRPARILGWAATVEDELVVLAPATLSHQANLPRQANRSDRAGENWRHVGWHEIERGGWNAETRQLRWQTYAGGRGALTLPDPARVPAVFAERVAASIVFEQFVPVEPGSDRGVMVNGRRDLADSGTALTWHTTLTRGVTWRTPGVRDLADSALAAVRHEYDDG